MATTQSISIYRGEDITLNFTMSPVEDITAWTLAFTVARARNSTAKLLTKSAAVVDGDEGTFRVVLDAEDTEGLTPGGYFFDVWRTDEGSERVLTLGPFQVLGVARLGDA